MRNDPYSAPLAALARDPGHALPHSRGKWGFLFEPIEATGVPLGGIGTGAITRASDGRFSRWTIKGGGVKHFSLPANGFILRQVRAGEDPRAVALQPVPQCDELSAFSYEQQPPEWQGLFPFAWHRHQAFAGLEAECLSFSPVIAGDLATASLPVALFKWRLRNTGQSPVEASLVFLLANMNGWFADFGEGRPERVAAACFNRPLDLEAGTGVILDRRRVAPEPGEGDGEWVIAVAGAADIAVSRTLCFDGSGDGGTFWQALLGTGDAPDLGPGWLSESGFRESPPAIPTGAVAARMTLGEGEEREVTFALVWDLPVIRFGQGRKWHRAYTGEFGYEGRAGEALIRRAFANADDWQRQVAAWHAEVAADLGDEPHRAGAAVNEAAFLVSGLSVHTAAQGSPDGRPHFGLIECHDYAFYNTLDLWIYAAEAVGRLFPELSAMVAADYADHVIPSDPTLRRLPWKGTLFPVSLAGAVPHDLGGPGEDPFVTVNSYTYRDTTIWKDLNCDLVLVVMREGLRMGREWRGARFAAVRAAVDHLQQFDTDGDGLIENDGTPDQTFDNIPMTGASSYCGGLWIAALSAAAWLAEDAGEGALSREWTDQARSAAEAFDRLLWNGAWFRVDTSGPLSEASFIEQLLGPFLARRLGLGDIVPPDKARSALRNVFRHNFVDEGGGEGAVSLAKVPDSAQRFLPHKADTSIQTAEIQPGFNYSLAAQLEEWGLWDEAEQLRKALHAQLYVKRNLVFQTPAAIDRGRLTCRAIMNMRPLAVWWMKPRRERRT